MFDFICIEEGEAVVKIKQQQCLLCTADVENRMLLTPLFYRPVSECPPLPPRASEAAACLV